MSEIRRDPIVGRWVIINPSDSVGPESFEKEDHTPHQEATCQFCPGREKQTPPEIEAIRHNGSPANSPDWTVRVIPNKFPALRIEGNLNRRGIGIFDMTNGVGAHEVVIETPLHQKNIADYTKEEVCDVLRKYLSRSQSLAGDKRFKYILIFKNYGDSAGASLEHAHSQIIALPLIPKYVLEELEGAKNYFDFRGRCVFCDMIHEEYQDRERIIAENLDFIAFCPYVPKYPFECWIFPKRHNSQFNHLNNEELANLASIMKELLTRIKVVLSDPSYNYYFHVAPVNYEQQESFHWHIEIIPQLTRVAGFEWGTGFYVIPITPNSAAKYLREAKV